MIDFSEIGRLPAAGDNCAIATGTLAAGTAVVYEGTTFTLSHTILEGHRFAVEPIYAGEALRSWGFPFGVALVDMKPGDYVCNEAVLDELNGRSPDFALPPAPNFSDQAAAYAFEADRFRPAASLPRYAEVKTFVGYPRVGRDCAGTRNTVVLLGTSALTAAFVRRLEERVRPLAADYGNIDDIVAVAHTEGAGQHINNRELLLRTLAGFMVHPNVGAVLAVDNGDEVVDNAMLRDFMLANGYPLESVPHYFLSRSGSFAADMERAAAIVEGWLGQVNGVERAAVPLSRLKIALQCGGSDAFSGVSGNPLAAWLAKEVLRNGGSANLAETDELVGAERYMMDSVRDRETAERFLQVVDRFQRWAERHGHSAKGNPSGGNLYRGLYNIYLKSIGAATKRHPDVPLDYVIDYAAPMAAGGFYFMDSPGNDLESVAGQVASGCNLILFVTGNGSITNFPFVPTIKIVTTSERYALLEAEMDINAGAYLDGTALEVLGRQSFDLMLDIVSGKRAAGERAGHAQVQIWRDWPLAEGVKPARSGYSGKGAGDGRPYAAAAVGDVPEAVWTAVGGTAVRNRHGIAGGGIGLILPTSLCAGQIARMCAERLNEQAAGQKWEISRFVALPHTEGCGSSTQVEFIDIVLGYATHPMVARCLLLEHGCEKTHNAFWRNQMQQAGIDPEAFGWASIQLDGGIQPVMAKMADWFAGEADNSLVSKRIEVGLEQVRLGLVSDGQLSERAAEQLATLAGWIASAGGVVVVPEEDGLLGQAAFLGGLGLPSGAGPTLGYAHRAVGGGLHVMERPSVHWSETLTGLGATGVEVVLAVVGKRPRPGHPFIPVLQVGEETAGTADILLDLDIVLKGERDGRRLLGLLIETLSGGYRPILNRQENVDFQITRGLLGVSL